MSRSIAAPRLLSYTLTPFLYPCLDGAWSQVPRHVARLYKSPTRRPNLRRLQSSSVAPPPTKDANELDHLDPAPSDYSSAPFTDACTLTVAAGAGGHGCISFLREKYIANGPPNGGDGGTGGSVYIQAVRGETSLHKIARRGILKASRGRNGQGSMKGGARGEDILITVPVGTVVREISRIDPQEEEDRQDRWASRGYGRDLREEDADTDEGPGLASRTRREKFLIYPGALPRAFSSADFPALPRKRRSNLASLQPPAPIRLDLDKPMETPQLLAAGAAGGMGNPHFITKNLANPKFATKGEDGMRISLKLELKLLADVGLVGLPNAGKSTLLRALTRSRSRVGNWEFTTLTPNIGTVVLDTYQGRPALDTKGRRTEPRTNFTIADIPGLIEDAHLDKGLGLGFLRHIERAAVLAFVVDLSARDAVAALKDLWREVGEYEKLRERELNAETEQTQPQEQAVAAYEPLGSSWTPGIDDEFSSDAVLDPPVGRDLPPLSLPPISSKPWLVIATKADLPETQENFMRLRTYLQEVQAGQEPHPSGKKNGWCKALYSVPISAIKKEGVSELPEIILRLLDD